MNLSLIRKQPGEETCYKSIDTVPNEKATNYPTVSQFSHRPGIASAQNYPQETRPNHASAEHEPAKALQWNETDCEAARSSRHRGHHHDGEIQGTQRVHSQDTPHVNRYGHRV